MLLFQTTLKFGDLQKQEHFDAWHDKKVTININSKTTMPLIQTIDRVSLSCFKSIYGVYEQNKFEIKKTY